MWVLAFLTHPGTKLSLRLECFHVCLHFHVAATGRRVHDPLVGTTLPWWGRLACPCDMASWTRVASASALPQIEEIGLPILGRSPVMGQTKLFPFHLAQQHTVLRLTCAFAVDGASCLTWAHINSQGGSWQAARHNNNNDKERSRLTSSVLSLQIVPLVLHVLQEPYHTQGDCHVHLKIIWKAKRIRYV